MERVVGWVKGFALTLGGPGLFIIAFLDSSLLSFPEVVDLLLMGLVIQHKERVLYYALLSTLGSITGCLLLYMIARKGGEAFLRRRFAGHHIDRALRLFQKYGLLAVAIPSILPPPVPFKIFVFAAGVARVPLLEFVAAIAMGRGVRYFGEAFLALWYGEAAIAFLKEHARTVAFTLAAVALVAGVAWIWFRRDKAARPPAAPGRVESADTTETFNTEKRKERRNGKY
jgi:membrane protein YqaA with SNARE-associated domain